MESLAFEHKKKEIAFKMNPRAPLVASKALGYATVLSISVATLLTVSTCYILNIDSMNKLTSKIQLTVDKNRDSLKHYLLPSLKKIESTATSTLAQNSTISSMTHTSTPSEIELEKEELKQAGFSEEIINDLYSQSPQPDDS